MKNGVIFGVICIALLIILFSIGNIKEKECKTEDSIQECNSNKQKKKYLICTRPGYAEYKDSLRKTRKADTLSVRK